MDSTYNFSNPGRSSLSLNLGDGSLVYFCELVAQVFYFEQRPFPENPLAVRFVQLATFALFREGKFIFFELNHTDRCREIRVKLFLVFDYYLIFGFGYQFNTGPLGHRWEFDGAEVQILQGLHGDCIS